MAPRREDSERSCVVTRTAQPPEGLIRFVRAPDGSVVPDVRGKLPGRGVWVTGRRTMVEEAIRRKLFARGFKAEATVDPALADLVDRLLLEATLASLSMARKAASVVTGYGKVKSSIDRGIVVAIVHAREAAGDGRRKIAQALRRRARFEADGDDGAGIGTGDWDDDDDEEGLDDGVVFDGTGEAGDEFKPDDASGTDNRDGSRATGPAEARLPPVIGDLFAGAELDLALGGSNVIHAALLAGGASTSFLNNAAALARYRGGEPETDWTAGLLTGTAKG